jgi:[protein-PII] uridylyltransferase
VLADLHDVGLLVAMIPEFATLVGRVHRDTYHVYTVDVHSVAAVDHLRAMCRGELSAEHPLASRLAAELPRRPVLFLAVLLHDIGKAYGGAGHTERGVDMARAILERLDIGEADLLEVQHLIQHHLSMYEVATRRDLDDPKTLSEFCAAVKQRETLHELYLLTIADVTTTNPSSMSNWKRRMLDALFVAAERQLSGAHSQVSRRTAAVRADVLGLWPEQTSRVFIEHFVSGLPERYFYANEPAAIVEHALFAASAHERTASIRQGSASHPYFELWVVADDRPGLLAMITALLSQSKLKVRSAQVYSWLTRDGRSRCLDIFWVRGPEDSERVARLLTKLERDLEQLLGGAIDPSALRGRALSGARSPRLLDARFTTEVNVDNKSASHYTIIEVITADRPALLFCLSNALQEVGLSIWFAKINTEGERVIDVFYVLGSDGQMVVQPAQISRVRQAIASAVEGLEAHIHEPMQLANKAS